MPDSRAPRTTFNVCSPSTSETSGACCQDLELQMRPELFKALCDPVRIGVLCRLATATEPQTVSEVAECCGVHLSGVSRHLAILRDAGVAKAEKVGREVRYRIDCAELAQTLRGLADAIDACQAACHPGESP